jgi:hypothetical protein
MISTKEIKLTWIFHTQRKQEHNTFKRELPTVDIITKEEIIPRDSMGPNDSDEIVETSMNITDNADGAINAQNGWLLREELAGAFTELDDVISKELWEWDAFSDFKDFGVWTCKDGFKTTKDPINNR